MSSCPKSAAQPRASLHNPADGERPVLLLESQSHGRLAPMTYAFTPVPQPTLPIKGSDKLFPIHRVYCVGRNYDEHTAEMGGDTKAPPFFFQKNPDNVRVDGKFPYPPGTNNVHFEIELVVAL